MGKRERIKRSPSHSQTKLSLKELKEFVDLTSDAIEKEVDPTNLANLRRSTRPRKPPKDPYANEFVGDKWTQLRCSKACSLDDTSVAATKVSDDELEISDVDQEQDPLVKENGVSLLSDSLKDSDLVFVNPDDPNVLDHSTTFKRGGPPQPHPCAVNDISPKYAELHSKIDAIKTRLEGFKAVETNVLSCDDITNAWIGVQSPVGIDAGSSVDPKNDTVSFPKVFPPGETHGSIITHTHLASFPPNGHKYHESKFEKPDFMGKAGHSFHTLIEGCGAHAFSDPTALCPLLNHVADVTKETNLACDVNSALNVPVTDHFISATCLEHKTPADVEMKVTRNLLSACGSPSNGPCTHVQAHPPCASGLNPKVVIPAECGVIGDQIKTNLKGQGSFGPIAESFKPLLQLHGQLPEYGAAPQDGDACASLEKVLDHSCEIVTSGPQLSASAHTQLDSLLSQPVGLVQREGNSGDSCFCPPTADLAEEQDHGISLQAETDKGPKKKKFNELFGSTRGIATQEDSEIPDITRATSFFDFPLDFVPHGTRSKNLILQVPKILTEEGSNEWGTTLVGYFIGKGLPYSLVTSATDRLWADYGLFDTLATDSGIFFFTFSSEIQRDAALEGGPWYIAGQPLILQPWKPSLRLDKKDVQSIPIWVNLYGIPLELWNPKGISFIASYIGKPLRVDRMTASRRRITYARVCVEVSGDLDFIDKFAIETIDGDGKTTLLDIAVEYQWMPIRCSKCSTFGHDCDKVASQKPGYGVNRAKPAQSYHPTTSLNRHHRAKEGVWQVVQRKDKGKKTAENFDLEGSARVSPQIEANNRAWRSTIDGSVACSSEQEHMIYSINNLPSICKDRTSTVPIDNSFNGLIPYVYDREDCGPLDVCIGSPLDEAPHEEDDSNEKTPETAAANAIDTPISGRQKKKEAKMLFSGSRPKGRHRS